MPPASASIEGMLARSDAGGAGLERALLSLGQRFSHPSDRKALGRLLRAAGGGGSALERAAAAAAPIAARRRRRRTAISHIETPMPAAPRWTAGAAWRWQSLHFAGQAQPALGGLPHGFFDDIALAGRLVHRRLRVRSAGRTQAHRPGMVRGAHRARTPMAMSLAFARIDTPKGPIEKRCAFAPTAPRVDFDLTFTGTIGARACCGWAISPCCRDAFDASRPDACHQQWRRARRAFALAGQTIDHGAPVSFLVSSSHGLGMTRRLGRDRRRQDRLAHRSGPRHRAAAGPADPSRHGAAAKACSASSSFRRWNWTIPASPAPIGPARAASASAVERDLDRATEKTDGRTPPGIAPPRHCPTRRVPFASGRMPPSYGHPDYRLIGSRADADYAAPAASEAWLNRPGTETGWSAAPDWRSTEPGRPAAA